MTDIPMPKLSDSMEEGTILSWLVADGERVEAGADLVEVETDKATMTVQAEASGVLEVLAPEGTTLAVGEPIARVGGGTPPHARDGTADAPGDRAPAGAGNGGRAAAAGNGGRASTETPAGSSGVELPARAGLPVDASGPAPRATPVARRAAEEHGVALQDVAGTGPLGRITRGDVLARAGVVAAPEAPAPAPAPTPAPVPDVPSPQGSARSSPAGGARGEIQVVEPSRLQALVARRMAEAKATAPDFQVQTEADMGAAIALRARLKDAAGDRPAPSLNDLVVKAAALALRAHPRVNGAYRDGRFELYGRVNVGIAVAAGDALVVPTIFDADELGLGAIAVTARRLAERVRDGSVTPPELSGATFTVSNLGMFGMTAISPVLNAGQAGILGVGAVREVLAREDGEIVERRLMTLGLTCDHRILHGADAARFLARIREDLEEPLRLVL